MRCKTFKCKRCKKLVEMPVWGDGEWGYTIGYSRYCTYNCMRAAERESEEKIRLKHEEEQKAIHVREYNKSEKRKEADRKKREATYHKVYLYHTLRNTGVRAKDAAFRSGFCSYRAATEASTKYRKTEEYLNYVKNKEGIARGVS